MIKDQNISVNPIGISGLCGKLKCCMEYEHSNYIELIKSAPKSNTKSKCPDGYGVIVDYNLLVQKAFIRLDNTGKIVEHKFSNIESLQL